jgi:integrase/recombinase XerD
MKLPPRKPPNFMTKEERDRILTILRAVTTPAGGRHYALTLTLFYSGLQEAELVHLKVEDAHLDEGSAYLHVREGKGRKDRLVPIPPTLRDGLRHYLATVRPALAPPADKPWLFIHCGHHGRYSIKPLDVKSVWHFVKDQIVPILGRKVTPHTFRHSYATHLYEGSSDLNLVKALLGHASINTTAVYAHVTPRKQRERLAEYLK